MNDIEIRPAREQDLDRIIEILYDDPGPDIRAIVGDLAEARRIGALTTRTGLDIQIERTVLATIEAQPVGLLETLRPSDAYKTSPIAILRVLVGGAMIAGPGALLSSFRYWRARSRIQLERPKGAYYIGELDVHPEHRNRGIGAALMRYAEEQARAEGFTVIALTTGISNPAQHLYTRSGFRIAGVKKDITYERITGVPGRMLMVKELASAPLA